MLYLSSTRRIDPLVTNGLSVPYRLDESIFIFRGIRINFSLFDENHVSKQNSPRWDAILFADIP